MRNQINKYNDELSESRQRLSIWTNNNEALKENLAKTKKLLNYYRNLLKDQHTNIREKMHNLDSKQYEQDRRLALMLGSDNYSDKNSNFDDDLTRRPSRKLSLGFL